MRSSIIIRLRTEFSVEALSVGSQPLRLVSSSLLDRVGNREDERIFEWIRHKSEKIREDDWREFEKGLHLYLKNKDTSVFTDKELFTIYESILEMAKYRRISFGQFSKDFPNSAKIKSKARRSKKYQAECFRIKKELRRELDEEIFSQAFEIAMK